jgi:DNA polymerase I
MGLVLMEYALESIEYSVEGRKPFVYLFARDKEGKRVLLKDTYRPFFFIDTRDKWQVPSSMSVRRMEDGYSSLYNRPLTKVEMTIPAMVRLFRERLHKKGVATWTADLEFIYRYLVDKGIYYGFNENFEPVETDIASKYLYFDIEAPIKEVTAISLACNGEKATLVQGVDQSILCNVKCVWFESEKALLEAFIAKVRELDPDVLIAWNINYDLSKLDERCKALKVGLNDISPMGLRRKDSRGYWKIKGREVFDLMEAFKILIHKEYEESPSGSLAYVARTYLKKEPITIADWKGTWRNDPLRIVNKNIQDVEFMLEVDKEYGVLELFNELRRSVGCRLKDTLKKSIIADISLLRDNRNLVLPNKYVHTLGASKEKETYEGAYRRAEKGIYDSVLYLDFKAFYPTIIILYNISPESYGKFKCTDEEGIVPKLLRKLMALREEKKQRLKEAKEAKDLKSTRKYDTQQYALKVVVNACYGQFGFKFSRLYNLDCAKKVTSEARKHIQELEATIDAFSHVFLVDTDGLMFSFEGDEKELMDSLSPLLGELRIELAEKYKRVIVLDKEQYAALTYDGEVKIKGAEYTRSDWSPYVKNVQLTVFKLVLEGVNKEAIEMEVKGAYESIEAQPLHQLRIMKAVKKPFDQYKVKSFHIKACKYSKQVLGLEWQVGDKPSLIPLKNGKWIATRDDTILPPSLLKEVDYDKIKEQFTHAIKQVTDLAGVDWNRVAMDSSTLDRWLSEAKG